MKEITKPVSDFLLHYESEIVCFESGTLQNPAVSATELSGFDPVGHPVKGDPDAGYVLAVQGETPTGWIAERGPISMAAGGTSKLDVRILVRGPAAVSKAGMPANDFVGTPLVEATQVAALEAAGISVRDDSSVVDVQTT